MGRLPKLLAALRDGGEDQMALALDEQDLGRRSLSECMAIYEAFREGRLTEQMIRKHYQTCQRQLELDHKDERSVREQINKPVTAMIQERREPLTKAALTHTLRV